MTSNLLISHPDISFNCNKVTCSVTDDSDFPHYNLISGRRDSHFQTAANQTVLTLTYDLGSGYASKQNTLNHIVLARCDILKAAGLTKIEIDRSSDGSAWTNQYVNASMASATLYGPRSDDYYDIPSGSYTPSSAYRYWRLVYTSSSQKFTHSKAHFGLAFDMGKDPVDVVPTRNPAKQGRFRGDSGVEHVVRTDEPVYQFEITWDGITDDKVRDFYSKIDAYKDVNRVFLFTGTDHTILDSQRIIHCEVSKVSSKPSSKIIDWNRISATFTEVLG
jgi:hypothetical protein